MKCMSAQLMQYVPTHRIVTVVIAKLVLLAMGFHVWVSVFFKENT